MSGSTQLVIEQISDLRCHKITPNADKPYNKSFLDEYSVIDNKLALMTITSMITAVLLLVITEIDADNSTIAKKYKAQTIGQVNNCGNYVSPTNVTCSNFGLNSEGHESISNISIVNHSFLPFP